MLARLVVGTTGLLAAACVSRPAPPERAAPSPLCAVDAWDGFRQVRRFRLAPVAFGAERPRPGAELAAACAVARGKTFAIEGEEADVADGAWMALGYNTARIRGESSYLGFAIKDPPPGYVWRPPANAFDILGDVTSIRASISIASACSERTARRCLEVEISTGRTIYLHGTETLWVVRDDQGWRLLDHNAYDRITIVH